MKCEFCEKEIEKDVKFCPFCGADQDPDTEAENKTSNEPKKEKKKVKPGKIILIVFLCSALLVGLVYLGGFFIFKAIFRDSPIGESGSKVFDYDEFYDEEEIEDAFDKYFSQYFDDDDYDDDDIIDEREYKGRYDDYEGVSHFKAGEITRDTNSYKSDFVNLSFSLPSTWDIYTDAELSQVYSNEGVSKTLANNNLFVYDFYAENSLSGDTFYVCLYNKDYFGEYENLDEFNKGIKDSTNQYATKYNVDYADDSTITINGDKYTQLACRISNDSLNCYQYDFTRDLGEYYLHIGIFAYDIDTVGSIIETLNAKG